MPISSGIMRELRGGTSGEGLGCWGGAERGAVHSHYGKLSEKEEGQAPEDTGVVSRVARGRGSQSTRGSRALWGINAHREDPREPVLCRRCERGHRGLR